MPLTSVVLQYTSDPVSDSTPTWATVSSGELMDISWWVAVSDETSHVEKGGATIRLVNKDRRWEPLFGSNVIDTHQRFRLTLNGTQVGLWFISGVQVEYPAGTEWSEVVVSCGDGSEVFALDNLALLDPPDAASYADVVEADEPWGYWQLGEPEGTRARPNIIRGRHTVRRGGEKVQRKFRRRRGTTYSQPEAGAASGPAGTYKNTPTLGVEGAIVGSSDTAVSFASASSEFVTFTLDDTDDTVRTNQLTLEAWVKPTGGFGTSMGIIGGPLTGGGVSVWALYINGSGKAVMDIDQGDAVVATGATTLTLDVWQHVVGTWNGAGLQVWVDGQLDGSSAFGGAGPIPTPSGATFTVGRYHDGSGTARYFNGTLDEVAVYEAVLSPERVLAHYQAGAERGYPMQTAGERIAAIAGHALWSEANIQTSGRDVQPVMQHGQPRVDEIDETAHSEGPGTMFFFNGQGDPVYLGHEWQAAAAAYRTVQATFGQAEHGETPIDGLVADYDHETFNEVTATHEGGDPATASDVAAQGLRGRRENTEYTDVLLMHHTEVESLAAAVLARYKDPARVVRTISVSAFDDARLSKLLTLDIGHLVRVNWSGETGARNGQVANIIRKQMGLSASERILRCVYTLSRGFDANDGFTRAGIVGFSEAGVTTRAA